MPLASADHPDRVVRPWLWGLLPDNELVVRRWAREFGTTTSHPLGLLAHQGRDLPGAFQIVQEYTDSDSLEAGSVDWISETAVAERLRAARTDHTAWLGSRPVGQWSLAGAQAKIALRHDGRRWGVPSGREPTTHILKPAISGLDDHDLNEHLCLSAIRLLGIPAVRTWVARFADERAIVVARYDRLVSSGQVIRVHQEDLCQALSVHPDSKYEADGGPGVTAIGELLRTRVGGLESPVWHFAQALILNWVLAAPDAHAKNYSLLLSGPEVRLAPLYDVASALPYQEFHEPKIRLAMKLGGAYSLGKIGASNWERVARSLRLDRDRVLNEARAITGALPDALAAIASTPQVKELGSALPDALTEAVSRRAKQCAERLE